MKNGNVEYKLPVDKEFFKEALIELGAQKALIYCYYWNANIMKN
jgi:hypothetical protein